MTEFFAIFFPFLMGLWVGYLIGRLDDRRKG